MAVCSVTFQPQNIRVTVEEGSTLLEASMAAHITINNLCGGDGICGRCKMIVKEGEVTGAVTGKLTRDEIKKGFVLACMTLVKSNLVVEIPPETLAQKKTYADKEADRFRDLKDIAPKWRRFRPSPLVTKIFITLDKPEITNNIADHQRVCDAIRKLIKNESTQMGLKIIQSIPKILRDNNYQITATLGTRRDITEVMNIEGGNTQNVNYITVIDIGTTTVVAHLVDAVKNKTVDARACFNSQGIYGREVTGRMISAEKKGSEELNRLLVKDINQLIGMLAEENSISQKNITAVVCAGNTAMGHFLLGLPTENIRRYPYVATSVAPPPLRAAEVGIKINPRGLLYSLPGISGWVGSDLTAGILATGIFYSSKISLLVDIGTNGEIIVGNKDWMMACSASAGPALEGASVQCGMRAESGAIEKVYVEKGKICYSTIGGVKPRGICGSGLIDLVAVLLREDVIDRSGRIKTDSKSSVGRMDELGRFILVTEEESHNAKAVYISESEIENIITAKAAIFAAMKILLDRLDLTFRDIEEFFIAGAFGNYIDVDNAAAIGLIPAIPKSKVHFAGNTSIEGAKIAALHKDGLQVLEEIREGTTYYDLMGADDYIEEFTKAMFLPHTDIELFQEEA